MKHVSWRVKYGFVWVTLAFFLFSLIGHWVFGWLAYADEAREHGKRPRAGEYTIQMGRDTLENWQSEFLQLIWQVAGLSFLLYVGSSQSKEGDERLEAKVDFLLSRTEEGRAVKQELDRRFMRG